MRKPAEGSRSELYPLLDPSSSTSDLSSTNGNRRSDWMLEPVMTLSRWTYYVKTS